MSVTDRRPPRESGRVRLHTVQWDSLLLERIERVAAQRRTTLGATIRYLAERGLNSYEGKELDAERRETA